MLKISIVPGMESLSHSLWMTHRVMIFITRTQFFSGSKKIRTYRSTSNYRQFGIFGDYQTFVNVHIPSAKSSCHEMSHSQVPGAGLWIFWGQLFCPPQRAVWGSNINITEGLQVLCWSWTTRNQSLLWLVQAISLWDQSPSSLDWVTVQKGFL